MIKVGGSVYFTKTFLKIKNKRTLRFLYYYEKLHPEEITKIVYSNYKEKMKHFKNNEKLTKSHIALVEVNRKMEVSFSLNENKL